MIGDGEWVSVLFIGQQELSLIVRTPQRIGAGARRQRRSFGLRTGSPGMRHQPMTIEHRMNGAAGRHFDCVRQPFQEALADLAGAPVGFLGLGGYNGRFDLFGPLIGIAEGAPGSIREPLQSAFLITLQELIASLAGNLELPAQCGHALAVFESNYKTYAFVHNRTFLPWHFTRPLRGKSVTHVSGTFCYLCLGPVKTFAFATLRLTVDPSRRASERSTVRECHGLSPTNRTGMIGLHFFTSTIVTAPFCRS